MSRPLRLYIPDGWYHITARGNERRQIYRTDEDRRHFVELLSELPERFGVRLAAYVLMDNHYHLILQTPRANVNRAVQWLNVSYSVWFNRRHGRSGHLFQGRYKAILVEGEGSWLLDLSLYVHLNPVRVAGLGSGKENRSAERVGAGTPPSREQVRARLAALRNHRWSSYPAYAGYGDLPPWLSAAEVLKRLGKEQAEGRRAYRELAERQVRQGVAESPWTRLRARVVLGSQAFMERLSPKGDRMEMTELRQWGEPKPWTDVVKAVEAVKGQKWEEFRDRYGDWGRDLALAVARRVCGLTLRELGEAAGGMSDANVSRSVRSFLAKLPHDPVRQRARELVLNRLND